MTRRKERSDTFFQISYCDITASRNVEELGFWNPDLTSGVSLIAIPLPPYWYLQSQNRTMSVLLERVWITSDLSQDRDFLLYSVVLFACRFSTL